MDSEVLKPLLCELEWRAAAVEERKKKELWANHQALLPTHQIPVSVYYEGIPVEQWAFMLGDNFLKCTSDVGREIEFYLRRVLWMARNVPDDHIVWPFIRVDVPMRTVSGWGVELSMKQAGGTLGAGAFAAPLQERFDMSRLTMPVIEVDEPAWLRKQEEVRALCGFSVGIAPRYAHLDFSPFDIVAQMRGLENIMMDALDYPEELHMLMNFVTEALIHHHQERERRGWINYYVDPGTRFNAMMGHRVHAAYAGKAENEKPKLCDEWPYISAQTSSGYGPDMFKEFVHEYNCKLAAMFSRGTVYYHGCECLDQKAEIIRELPNLRRFHVSPWTSLAKISEIISTNVVLEVHVHPSHVMMHGTESGMRKEIRRLIDEAQGHPMDLNLSDIHSVNGNPTRLGEWAKFAKEEVFRC